MALYPILIDFQDMPCLIAGGGALARHKAELLCAQGARVTVVAPEVCQEISALPVTIYMRLVMAEDVLGQFLVIDATGNAEAERLLNDACRSAHIPFNSACRGEDTTAVFPAVHRQGPTMIAVSSAGASPAASAWLRDKLAAHVPAELDDILDSMRSLRPLSRAWFSDQPTRRLFLHRCLDCMLEEGRPLAAEEIERFRQEIVEKGNDKEDEL